MQTLLLTPNFFPEKTGIAVSATDTAKFIRDLGHQVHVVTSVPYYPEWKIPENYSKKLIYKEEVENIKVWRLGRYVPSKPTSIKRMAHELSFGLHALFRCLFVKTDLVICISPPLILGFFSLLIALLKGKKFYFYVQDIQPDAAIKLGMLNNKFLLFALKLMEKFIYRFSNKILVLCEEMRDNISNKGVSKDKIFILPLAVDTQEFVNYRNRETSEAKFRKSHNLESKFLVIYSGNLGVKQEPQILVEAARLLENENDIFIAIVGDGAQKSEVESQIKQNSLSNVCLYPLVEREDFADLLSAADILICTMREEVSSFSVPSKVYSYLAANRPVIVSAAEGSAAAGLIDNHDLGYLCVPGSARDIVDTILKIKSNKNEAQARAKHGSEHVDQFYSYSALIDGPYKALFTFF